MGLLFPQLQPPGTPSVLKHEGQRLKITEGGSTSVAAHKRQGREWRRDHEITIIRRRETTLACYCNILFVNYFIFV
jgi:hypothetical protein